MGKAGVNFLPPPIKSSNAPSSNKMLIIKPNSSSRIQTEGSPKKSGTYPNTKCSEVLFLLPFRPYSILSKSISQEYSNSISKSKGKVIFPSSFSLTLNSIPKSFSWPNSMRKVSQCELIVPSPSETDLLKKTLAPKWWNQSLAGSKHSPSPQKPLFIISMVEDSSVCHHLLIKPIWGHGLSISKFLSSPWIMERHQSIPTPMGSMTALRDICGPSTSSDRYSM